MTLPCPRRTRVGSGQPRSQHRCVASVVVPTPPFEPVIATTVARQAVLQLTRDLMSDSGLSGPDYDVLSTLGETAELIAGFMRENDGLITLEECRCVGACSQAPVIVSHGNPKAVQPSKRNIGDDVIKAAVGVPGQPLRVAMPERVDE